MKVSTSNTIFCNRCFSHFRTENSLAMHSKLCNTGENVIRVFPNKGETLSYTEHQYNYKRIYTGYAEFQSILKKQTIFTVVRIVSNQETLSARKTVIIVTPLN